MRASRAGPVGSSVLSLGCTATHGTGEGAEVTLCVTVGDIMCDRDGDIVDDMDGDIV